MAEAAASATGSAATGERRAGQSRGLRTVVATAVPATRVRLRGVILDDDADDDDIEDDDEPIRVRSMTETPTIPRPIPPSLASRSATTIAFGGTNSPRTDGTGGHPGAAATTTTSMSTTTTRSQRQSSGREAGATPRSELEWSVDLDEAWMPKPARLHSGKTRSCVVCFAPLQYTSMQSWDEYVQSEEYLQQLQENLLSDAFISSLICGENTSGGDLPTEYRMHKNRKLKCRQSVHDYVNMIGAGVIDEAYKERSSVRILEEMLLHGLSTPLFAGVLERRLAVISHSTEIARKLMQESQRQMQRIPREVSPARPNVELHHLAIQTLSALLQSFDCTMNAGALQAFGEMARLLSCFPTLSLYSFWSPVQRSPEVPLTVVKSQVEASSCATTLRLMAAEFAVDGSDTSFWQSHPRPGVTYFTIRHAELSKVSSICIRWHLKCFPKCVAVQYRIAGSDVFIPLAEQFASSTNGPEYFGVKFPRRCEEVRLALSGIPVANRSACFAIEDLKLNTPVTNSLFVDPKSTLSDVSEWLLRASVHPSEEVVVEAISALRAWSLATASLGGVLAFVRMLLKMKEAHSRDVSGLSRTATFAIREAKAFVKGLKAYHADELERVAKGAGKKTGSESRKIRGLFEPSCCSSGVTIEDGGMVVRTRETSYQYAAVNVGISSGRASWKFRLDNDTVDDEMTCFGAAILPVTVSGYDSSPNLWMLRGYNGNLYARGHKLSRSIGKVHPGDTVQIDIDMTEGTLGYKINDTDYGPVFTDLAGHEVYPAVSFYGSGKVITLLSVEKWDDSDSGGATVDPVYLSNLKEYHYSVGYGSLGKGSQLGYASDADARSATVSSTASHSIIQIAGEAKQRCLSLHPPARGDAFVLYDVGESYSMIAGAVAINDDVLNDVLTQRAVAVLFSIVGDGVTLWQSKPIAQIQTLETFNVDVRKVRMIELRVSCPGSNHCAHAIWVDPHVIMLDEWKCSDCKVSNKGSSTSCVVCGGKQPCTFSHGELSSEQACARTVVKSTTDSSSTSGSLVFDEVVNSILFEVVELTRIGKAGNSDQGGILSTRFEQPYCRQPCEEVLLQLLAMVSHLQQSSESESIVLERSLFALGLMEANLKSIATYDVAPRDLGIKKSTITSLKSVLEAIAFGSTSSDTSPSQEAAAKTLIAGFPMLYTPSQKIQLLLALLRGCSDSRYKPQSAKQVVLTSMLQTLALPGRDGVLNFLPYSTGDSSSAVLGGTDEMSAPLTVSDIEEVVFLLVSTACKVSDQGEDPIAEGSMRLLQSYQLMLLAEALEITQKKVSTSADIGSLQTARTYIQEATINYASLLLRFCGNILTKLVEQHAEDVLVMDDPEAASTASTKLSARVFNLPILSKLLPWLISCLCLLRRQSWLAIPILPSVIKFSTSLSQACAELTSVKSTEARIRRLERSIKARTVESQLVERMLATDKTLAKHHQASKPMYNVFKQLYTGDKDHFEGQIGFQFEATSTFSIIALGRSVNPNKNGGTLVRQHAVRLWEETSQTLIAHVTIGATSRKDSMGYAFEPLSAPVKLTQGKLYRLTTQEFANGGDPWYKKENLPDEEYDASYIKVLRDCYASGSTSFPSSQNLSGAAYGVPTFLVEGENPLSKVPRFLAPFGSTALKFSAQKKSPATQISHSGTSAHVLDGGNDVWRTCFLQTSIIGGVHSIDFIVKCTKPGGVSSGHVSVGVDWSQNQSLAKTCKFIGSTLSSVGWMPSIGLVWAMGRRIHYGTQKQVNIGDILTIVVDCDHQLLSFLHNGVNMGVALGPPAYSPWCSLPGGSSTLPSKLSVGFSMNGTLDVVQVRPSGLAGSTLRIHWLLDLHNTTASFAGRLCSTLIAGNPVDGVEEELLPWLQSPLLSGGASSIQPSTNRDESPDWHTAYQAEEAKWKDESLTTPTTTAVVRPLTRVDRVKSEGATGKPRLVKRSSFFDEIGLDESIFLEDLTKNMDDTGPAALVIAWLEKVSPDRSFLSRLGKFSVCERPTCAALIKHSPIHVLHEVQAIISSSNTFDGKHSIDHIDLVPSDDLVSIWKRIIMMRHWLIKSRQEYRAKTAIEDVEGAVPSPTATDPQPGSSSISASVGELDMHIVVPRTFEELLTQIQERAMFLSALNPPAEERGRMRVESQVALSNLAEKWSAQNTPPSLEPMLERWKSLTESDSSKWSGIVDVLRAQHRWRARRVSVHFGANPLDNSPIQSPAVVPDVEDEASVDHKNFKYRSSFAAMLRACDLYIRNGIGAPPEILRTLLERRHRRSECRILGLDAMKSLISNLSMDSTRHSAIIFLRPAFRGFTDDEKESRDLNDGVVVAETFRATVRHHYLKGLEGCSRRTLQRVQQSFWNLYTILATLIAPTGSNAVDAVDSSLKQAIICSWCLDFEPRDHSYLLKSGLLTTLQNEISMGAVLQRTHQEVEQLKLLQDARACDDATAIDGAALNWQPLADEFVQRGALSTGHVTKRDIMHLILRAPSFASSNAWWREHVLQSDESSTAKHTVSAVSLRYSELLNNLRTKISLCQERTLTRKVLQFGLSSSPSGSSQSGSSPSLAKADQVSYAELPSLGSVADFTMEMWLFATELGSYRALWADNGFQIGSTYVELLDRCLQVSINGNIPREQLFKRFQFDTHTWTHVAVVYTNVTKTLELIVNGVLRESKTYEYVGKAVVFREARLGCWQSDSRDASSIASTPAQRVFKGSIAELRLWKVARSPFQIARNYQRAVPLEIKASADGSYLLLGSWHLDEGEGACGNNRLQPHHSRIPASEAAGGCNASLVACHWIHANVPVWSGGLIDSVDSSTWMSTISRLRAFQRFARRKLASKSERVIVFARAMALREEQTMMSEWHDDDFDEDEGFEVNAHTVETKLPYPPPLLKVLATNTDDVVIHEKQVKHCAWIVFRFLAHMSICGTQERTDNEATSIAAAAKSRRKLRIQSDGGAGSATSSPLAAAARVPATFEEDQGVTKVAELASDAAKTAASSRQLEEPALQMLWFSNEMHRKVFEIIEKELGFATAMIQTAEGLTRAQRMIRSTSTPVQDREVAIRPQSSVLPHGSRKPSIGASRQVSQGIRSALSAFRSESATLEPLEVESYVFGVLTFVLSQSASQVAMTHLARPRVLRELLQLLRLGSPRSQRIVKLILRRICGSGAVGPKDVAAILGSEAMLVDLLLDQVAESVCSTAAPMQTVGLSVTAAAAVAAASGDGSTSSTLIAPITESLANPVGFRSGQVYLAAASESVALLRLLMNDKRWGAVVSDLLSSAIKNVTPILARRRFQQGGKEAQHIVASDIRIRTAVIRAVGSLCVLGSHTDCLRIGGKVEVTTKETQADGKAVVDYGFKFGSDSSRGRNERPTLATLIELNSRSSSARVVFDSSDNQSDPTHNVQEVNLAMVSPVEEVQLPADATPLSIDMMPVILKLASLDQSDVIDSFDELWRMQIRSRALLAFESILRHHAASIGNQKPLFDRTSGIPPSLLEAALSPVELSTFVSVPFLQERGRMILCRLIEASTPFGDPMFRGLPDPKPSLPSDPSSSSADTVIVESTDDPVEEETEEYRSRRGFASTLAAMGFEFDLCMAALDHSRNDPNAAVEWLMGAGAIEYQERQEARRLAAATLASRQSAAVPLNHNPDTLSSARSSQDAILTSRAEELQSISGMPFRLAYCALEMANADPNRAMEWLMEHGSRYTNKVGYMMLLSDDLRTDKSLSLSDAAALEGIDQPDLLITNSSSETAIDADAMSSAASGGSIATSDPSTIMAVTLAPILAPLPEKPIVPKKKNAREPHVVLAQDFAPLDPDYLSPYVLLTVSNETGPVHRLSTSGRTGVFRTYSPQDGVLITFLNTETGAYEDEWHEPTDVRRITRIYDEVLDGVTSVHRVALRTEKALSTHYARRGVAALLHAWETVSSPSEPAWSRNVLAAVGGPRQFVNLLKLVAASEMVFSRRQQVKGTVEKKPKSSTVRSAKEVKREEPSSILHDLQAIALRILQDEAESSSSAAERRDANATTLETVFDCAQDQGTDSAPSITLSSDEDPEFLAAIALSMEQTPPLPPPPPPQVSLNSISESKEEESESLVARLYSSNPRATRTRQPSYTEVQAVASAYLGGSVDDHDGLLSSVLVKECVSHFVESTRVAGQGASSANSPTNDEEVLEFQSLHPYYGRCDYSRAVALDKSHRSLRVKFDQRCKLGPKAKLTFYADAGYEKALFVVDASSTSSSWTPLSDLLIHSHQFWFKFTTSEEDLTKNHGYGFRFQVKPMQSIAWSTESEVQTNASLEWACWVLDFLLNEATDLVAKGAVHNAKIYGALVRYLRSPSAPFKSRVVRLLIQLLHTPEKFPLSEIPDLTPLMGISSLAIAQAERDKDAGKVFLSAQLLQLIELSIVTRRAADVFEEVQSQAAAEEKNDHNITNADIVLPTPVDQKPMPETLHDLVTLAKFLLGHSDDLPPHALMAIWLDVYGSTAIVETEHPYGPDTELSGRITFPGARNVLATFDSRCATVSNAEFRLRLVPESYPEPPVMVWSYSGADSWPSGPVDMSGSSTVTYEFAGGENPDAKFGVSVSIAAAGLSHDKQLARVTVDQLEVLRRVLREQRTASGWTQSMDGQLVEWVNATVETSATSSGSRVALSVELKPSEIRIHRTRDALRCSQLLDTSMTQLQLRFSLLKHLNQLFKRALPLLDLRDIASPWTVAHMLRQLGHCIFFDTKNALVDAAIDATSVPGDTNNSNNTARITLDRLQALESRDDREVEPSVSECFFAQAFRQLHHQVEPSWFRRKIDNKGRLFSVKFRGEEGVDWGGVYREGVNSMVDDLFSAHFSLFVLCPNGQHDTGTNRAMHLPNPMCTSPIAIQMFEFVGKLLGISLRTHGDFPFAFPSLVWKQLIGQPLDRGDLEGTDAMFVQMLDGIRNCERDGIFTEDEFDAAFEGLDLKFTAFNCNGHEVELVEDGKVKRVGYANRLEYCQLAESYRLQESTKQVAAMARGLATVFPLRVLTVLTWHEMEMLTCGSPKIDIALWKHHTRYDGYNENDDTVKLFWEAMASFTDEQRSDFVRFAWGRSRLPRGKWPQPFKLTKKGGRDSTMSLPVAHTCFFSVELPPYTTLDKMKSMLLATINFGLGGILMA